MYFQCNFNVCRYLVGICIFCVFSIFSTMKKEDKTTCSQEGFHRWFNTLQMQNGNFQNFFKTVNVLRKINSDSIVKIDNALAGKKHRQRTKDFEKRDDEIIEILKVYEKQSTFPTKLRQLHLIASKLIVEVLTDIQDDTVDDED